ncbi:TPA: erythromycin resistance leader peptide [Streptococcus agalactiae]
MFSIFVNEIFHYQPNQK